MKPIAFKIAGLLAIKETKNPTTTNKQKKYPQHKLIH